MTVSELFGLLAVVVEQFPDAEVEQQVVDGCMLTGSLVVFQPGELPGRTGYVCVLAVDGGLAMLPPAKMVATMIPRE